MALGAEAGHVGDFPDCVLACEEELCRAVQAAHPENVVGGHACQGFDFAIEVCAGESELASEGVDVEIGVAYVVVDVGIEFCEEFAVEWSHLVGGWGVGCSGG